MAHHLWPIAARLGPFGVHFGRRKQDRDVGQRGIDLGVRFRCQDWNPLTNRRGLRPLAAATAKHAAPGQRKRHRAEYQTGAKRLHLVTSLVGRGAESTPKLPAICTARERMVSGTFSSLPISANILPASSALPILR